MKLFFLFFVFLFISNSNLSAQDEELSSLGKEYIVNEHKKLLHMVLLIDSVIIGKKSHKLNVKHDLNLEFESEVLQIKDDLFIKVFIGRTQEYGSKFYSWRWDFLRKKQGSFTRAGSSIYSPVRYGKSKPDYLGREGVGVGEEGEPDYFMIYYRYTLE